MRTKPNLEELAAVSKQSTAERLKYWLHAVIETEEVWGLGNQSGWVLGTTDEGESCLPVWPFKESTTDMISGDWDEQEPLSMSLEHFLYQVLGKLKDGDIPIEIFPTKDSVGEFISAHTLYDTLEGMIDAGEYYMEG